MVIDHPLESHSVAATAHESQHVALGDGEARKLQEVLGMLCSNRTTPRCTRISTHASVHTRQHTRVSTRQHTSAHVSTRQHTSAHVSTHQHTRISTHRHSIFDHGYIHAPQAQDQGRQCFQASRLRVRRLSSTTHATQGHSSKSLRCKPRTPASRVSTARFGSVRYDPECQL